MWTSSLEGLTFFQPPIVPPSSPNQHTDTIGTDTTQPDPPTPSSPITLSHARQAPAYGGSALSSAPSHNDAYGYGYGDPSSYVYRDVSAAYAPTSLASSEVGSPRFRAANGQHTRRVVFEVVCESTWKEGVKVVGSIPALGDWQVRDGLSLKTDTDLYPLWVSAPVEIPVGEKVEYKYVKCAGPTSDLTITWEREKEGEGNRCITLPADQDDCQKERLRRFTKLEPLHEMWDSDQWHGEMEVDVREDDRAADYVTIHDSAFNTNGWGENATTEDIALGVSARLKGVCRRWAARLRLSGLKALDPVSEAMGLDWFVRQFIMNPARVEPTMDRLGQALTISHTTVPDHAECDDEQDEKVSLLSTHDHSSSSAATDCPPSRQPSLLADTGRQRRDRGSIVWCGLVSALASTSEPLPLSIAPEVLEGRAVSVPVEPPHDSYLDCVACQTKIAKKREAFLALEEKEGFLL
ncbi:unnamed protein product [Vitrella brassicaformis CCMP3155]|uniref:CBM20 domain-containing protein n=2 Tax=Vitrella brassicaformis TaxID=1169539 RepID=A0A0G4ESR9_VITBC|nr:unnamed protein product [Vitrella brassicaformis CCMP3155]|eukprot:CEM01692.1 unnamed protein product [Vitrella brassicaformis CCMP3155]